MSNLEQAAQQALEALERGETKLRFDAITSLRAALEQHFASAAPGGWKLVPVKPTKEMQRAGLEKMDSPFDEASGRRECKKIYRAMLAAAPEPTAEDAHGQVVVQALSDPENQPNRFGVEFGMTGTNMHFKIGSQLFRLGYEPDDQEDFEFMKRMLIKAFSTFAPDVKTQPATHGGPAAMQPVSKDLIRKVFLENGFTVKEGQTDLKPYVYEAAHALLNATLPAGVAQKPVGFMNAGHVYELEQKRMPYGYVYAEEETGADVALYTAIKQPRWIAVSDKLPTEEDGEVLVRMRDGRHEIAWATYWHSGGATLDFAQWTFRDPDETEVPTHWQRIEPVSHDSAVSKS